MMTGTPGPSGHYPGDGCTGEQRELTLPEGREIRSLATRLLRHVALAETHARVAVAPGPWDAIADEGSYLARHYGTDGEWFLSGLLSRSITGGNNGARRAPFNLPQLAARVPHGDPQALALLATLASRYREPATADLRAGHLDAARLPVQTYILHMHTKDYGAARRQWVASVQGDTDTPPLAALSFTTLLILWAARCHLGAPPSSARATAPLN